MKQKFKSLYLKNEQVARYFVMASIIVLIELASYTVMIRMLGINFLVAVPLSMAIAIVLNWYFSGKFVFKTHRHSRKKEFALVLIASLVGVGFQLTTTFVVVEILLQRPEIGKLLAILVTFFWNYFSRKRYIF